MLIQLLSINLEFSHHVPANIDCFYPQFLNCSNDQIKLRKVITEAVIYFVYIGLLVLNMNNVLEMAFPPGLEETNDILFDCPVTHCKFQSTDSRHLPLHLALSHSSVDGNKLYELFTNIISKLTHDKDPEIHLHLQQSDYLHPPRHDNRNFASSPAEPSAVTDKKGHVQSAISTERRKSLLIPNTRLLAGNLSSVSQNQYYAYVLCKAVYFVYNGNSYFLS